MGIPGRRMAHVASAESVQDMLFLLHAGAAKRREFLIWRRWLPLSTPAKNFAKKWKKMVGQHFLRRQRSSEPVSKASPSS